MSKESRIPKTNRTMHRLTRPQMFELIRYVQEHFTASGLTDALFAAQASGALSMTVMGSHISGIREDFGIASNRKPKAAVVADALLFERLASLEAQVQHLQTLVQDLRLRP